MKYFFMIIVSFLSLSSMAQTHPNIMIGDQNQPEEPSIYVNPKNTNEIVAGANIKHYYYSQDGGYTWQGDYLSSSYGVAGDPCIIADTTGAFYYLHLSSPAGGSWLDRITCQKSTDGGINWNNGSYMGLTGKDQDKQWAVVDWNTNIIYTTWTQFDTYGSPSPSQKSNILFSKSVDGGQSWSSSVKINEVEGDCIDDDNTVEGAVPAVGPEGQVYVAWAGPEGIVFDRSPDGGQSWLEEDIFVTDFPGGWAYDIEGIMRANGLPITVCDVSGGEYNGNIYINWTDHRNGNSDTDVWLTKSTDGGDTWSEPIRVNDDPPGKEQFFTWMAIDQTNGYLWFVWYDRRNYPDTETDVYMAVSTDGGESFINFRVSEQSFVPSSGIFFGDYTNISVHNNVVRPIWTRLHNSQLSVWTAIVDVDEVLTGEKYFAAIPYAEMETNFPNPFILNTNIRFRIIKKSNLSLRVYDVLGNLVATIFDNETKLPGKYTEVFDANKYHLSAGSYYISLTGENINIKQKMLLSQ
jgi:hypothetical protein